MLVIEMLFVDNILSWYRIYHVEYRIQCNLPLERIQIGYDEEQFGESFFDPQKVSLPLDELWAVKDVSFTLDFFK